MLIETFLRTNKTAKSFNEMRFTDIPRMAMNGTGTDQQNVKHLKPSGSSAGARREMLTRTGRQLGLWPLPVMQRQVTEAQTGSQRIRLDFWVGESGLL